MIGMALAATVSAAPAQAPSGAPEIRRFTQAKLVAGLSVAENPEDVLIGMTAVKGAPYAAETRSETVQTLAGGNRIVHRSSARIYRDSEGRTRKEYAFASPGAAETTDLVAINDPVAGVAYTLHPAGRTAEKVRFSGPVMPFTEPVPPPPVGAGIVENRVFIRRAIPPEGVAAAPVPGGAERGVVIGHAGAAASNVIFGYAGAAARQESTSESLGTRVMEGVQVDGKKTTVTLPAGAIGNELPLVTTTETWYSPELQTTLYSKRDDPLSGTTVFQVTKLRRSEPDAALFQVPSDYAVGEAPMFIQKFERGPAK
jgi:hypothetical protein